MYIDLENENFKIFFIYEFIYETKILRVPGKFHKLPENKTQIMHIRKLN